MKRTLAIVALLAIAAIPIFSQDKEFKRYEGGDPKARTIEGKPAIPLTGGVWFNTSGKKLELKSLKGKVVVLDFWAHW